MDILKMSQVAKRYYESVRSKSTYSGYEKYVLTDGQNCLFVDSVHLPEKGQAVFRCDTRRLETHIQLHQRYFE